MPSAAQNAMRSPGTGDLELQIAVSSGRVLAQDENDRPVNAHCGLRASIIGMSKEALVRAVHAARADGRLCAAARHVCLVERHRGGRSQLGCRHTGRPASRRANRSCQGRQVLPGEDPSLTRGSTHRRSSLPRTISRSPRTQCEIFPLCLGACPRKAARS
jgi:hypothetical protein